MVARYHGRDGPGDRSQSGVLLRGRNGGRQSDRRRSIWGRCWVARPQRRDCLVPRSTSAGLVADAPAFRQTCTQPRIASLIGDQPCRQLLARCSRQRRGPEDESLQVSQAIAFGVVVSRVSSGKASLSEGSSRSSRVTWSPRLRAKAVSPGGPPIPASSRLPAVLSLRVIAASHIAATVMPSPASLFGYRRVGDECVAIGEVMRADNGSSPRSTRARRSPRRAP